MYICIVVTEIVDENIFCTLQGFTEAVWRNVHSEVFGGIDGYYTPFLRYEHGEIRSKDIRDVERKNNTAQNLVPQVIAATPDEMRPLLELIANEGYTRVVMNAQSPSKEPTASENSAHLAKKRKCLYFLTLFKLTLFK